MAALRRLSPDDRLPLTCTRSGTCCHGKDIPITPWELDRLARARGLAASAFRDACTIDAGSRLRMAGPPGWRGLTPCTLYDPAAGCSVHAARPLACRLYPLGREVRDGRERFVHEGRTFPCLDGCPEVAAAPSLSVRDYLAGQDAAPVAAVRDAYLELAQDCAEGAFVLVFDTGLAASGAWREAWTRTVRSRPDGWAGAMLPRWHDLVTAPGKDLAADPDDGAAWTAAHAGLIQARAQAGFGALSGGAELLAASVTMLAAGLLLVHAVGGEAGEVGGRWLARASTLPVKGR